MKLIIVSSCLLSLASAVSAPEVPFFANGLKVGEVTQKSAIVWVRLTKEHKANFGKLKLLTEGLPSNAKAKIDMPLDVVPGMEGEARVRLTHLDGNGLPRLTETEWAVIGPETDYCHQFKLKNLVPGISYQVIVEARGAQYEAFVEGRDINASYREISGQFRTAPEADQSTPVRFIVSTCQAVRSIDSAGEGHQAYKHMLAFKPHFFVHTGDILYYDKVPLAKNRAQARAKWNTMFAYGHNKMFHRWCTSYFMKDDHDTLKNDCWPGQKYGNLTFDEGLAIFREQVPMGEKTYRTYRWGKDVQIWMTENRDFRSANSDPDGPEKTILGKEQKAWLKKTMSESDATFKFLISPGPLVGPDKRGKKDNHANAVFAHEGQELRDFVATLKNTYVICGDRHWQYCSVDPKTKVLEMGCGPINDEHKFGGHPGRNEEFHRYFGSRGGFLGITVEGEKAKAEWFSANEPVTKSGSARVLHTERFPQ